MKLRPNHKFSRAYQKIDRVTQLLRQKHVGSVLTDESLARHSTWKIGGPADILVIPRSLMGIKETLRIGTAFSLPLVIIGCGSNLLFDDAGVRGIVLKVGHGLSYIKIKGRTVLAGAGVWAPCLARSASKAGLSGLEHIVGIPGTLGGLIYMNGGSQGQSIGKSVRKVYVIDRRGKTAELARDECSFGYRKSIFQQSSLIILGAELLCERSDPKRIREEMLSVLRNRNKKFPRKLPSCGSVFVSDPALYKSFGPPAKIIEECMLKGTSVGDAEVSTLHANFIVNKGGATSAQVIKLVDIIRKRVYERTKCWLRCEVRYVSPVGEIRPLHLSVQDPL